MFLTTYAVVILSHNSLGDTLGNLAHDRYAVVSSESDSLILVNENDDEIGFADKATCHDGEGLLHRAFSVLIFNSRGELLLQRRAPGKRLWGDYWSNSCCSHPRQGEDMESASARRLWEELGLKAELRFLYKFQYAARFGDAGSERELCWVYAGISDQTPSTNSNEISDWRYVSPQALDNELAVSSDQFTPWFKMEWREIVNTHMASINALIDK